MNIQVDRDMVYGRYGPRIKGLNTWASLLILHADIRPTAQFS